MFRKNQPKAIHLIALLLAATLLFFGCLQMPVTDQNNSMEKDAMIKDTMDANDAMEKNSTILVYTEESFNSALINGKTVVLVFSANWCPICQANKPFIESGTKELDTNRFAVMLVHYKDDQSNPEGDTAIAQHNVIGQHTIVAIAASGEELGRTRQDFSDGSFNEWVLSLS